MGFHNERLSNLFSCLCMCVSVCIWIFSMFFLFATLLKYILLVAKMPKVEHEMCSGMYRNAFHKVSAAMHGFGVCKISTLIIHSVAINDIFNYTPPNFKRCIRRQRCRQTKTFPNIFVVRSSCQWILFLIVSSWRGPNNCNGDFCFSLANTRTHTTRAYYVST